MDVKRRTMLRYRWMSAVAFGVLLGLAGSAQAAVKYWIGLAGGNFSDPSTRATTSGGANNTTAPGPLSLLPKDLCEGWVGKRFGGFPQEACRVEDFQHDGFTICGVMHDNRADLFRMLVRSL